MMQLIRTFFAFFLFFAPILWATEENSSNSEQLLYLSYTQLPEKLFVGEVFEVKIKIIDTTHSTEPLHVEIGG
ncbi:MAG: hypothetical protein KU37_11425, partial [Sulfuricurvum sp. PC08-66]